MKKECKKKSKSKIFYLGNIYCQRKWCFHEGHFMHLVDNSLTDEESSDEETNFVPSCIEDFSQENYVLYEWVDNKYYVGTITDITSNEITVNLMK